MINIATASAKKAEPINIRGAVIKDYELSRASQFFTQKEKIPETRIKGLKSDAQRKEDLRKEQRKKDEKEGNANGYFDKKAEEF